LRLSYPMADKMNISSGPTKSGRIKIKYEKSRVVPGKFVQTEFQPIT